MVCEVLVDPTEVLSNYLIEEDYSELTKTPQEKLYVLHFSKRCALQSIISMLAKLQSRQ